MYSMEGMKNCPLDITSKLIGKKFTVLILRNMTSKQTRFNQFIESNDGINPKTLSTRLKEMEKNGLIRRKIYHETPIRIEYYLTKKGLELKSILDQMVISLHSTAQIMFSRMESLKPIKRYPKYYRNDFTI